MHTQTKFWTTKLKILEDKHKIVHLEKQFSSKLQVAKKEMMVNVSLHDVQTAYESARSSLQDLEDYGSRSVGQWKRESA